MSSSLAWAKARAMLVTVARLALMVSLFEGGVWSGKLMEHLVNEIVEQDFGGMIQLGSERDHM